MDMQEQIDEPDDIHEQPTCRSCGRPEGTNVVCEECGSVRGPAGLVR